jgi:hypothetical protein
MVNMMATFSDLVALGPPQPPIHITLPGEGYTVLPPRCRARAAASILICERLPPRGLNPHTDQPLRAISLRLCR